MERKYQGFVDTHFKILCLQIITVVLIMAIAICIRLFGGNLYRVLSNIYHEKFDDITTTDEVLKPDKSYNEDSSENTSSDIANVNIDDLEYELYDSSIDGEEAVYIDTHNDVSLDSINVSTNVNSFLVPIEGTVTSKFGMRTNPITGKYIMHGGVDIANVTGTEIKCAYDGVVDMSGYSDSYGYFVLVSHSSNVKTLYAHCSELIATKGGSVKKGEAIALVGSTGRSTGPHLHFELRIGGNKVDPMWLFGDKISV